MAATPRLGVVGSANVDLVVWVATLPEPGETIRARRYERLPGGKGANQAAAAAALGMDTSLFAAVGGDDDGAFLRDTLNTYGVTTTGVTVSSRATGRALIAVDEAGENTIVIIAGANETIDLRNQPLEECDVVLAQCEIPVAAVIEASRRAKRFILNVAPALELPNEVFRACEVVIVNHIEARSVPLEDIENCVITEGAQGARLLRRGEEIFRCVPPEVHAVDTVGAGDAFCAALAVHLARGGALVDALQYATTAGALATLDVGAQGARPTHQEVQQWLSREL
jgi:ribokinase